MGVLQRGVEVGGTADTEVCVFPNEIYRAPDVPSYEDVCQRLRRGETCTLSDSSPSPPACTLIATDS